MAILTRDSLGTLLGEAKGRVRNHQRAKMYLFYLLGYLLGEHAMPYAHRERQALRALC